MARKKKQARDITAVVEASRVQKDARPQRSSGQCPFASAVKVRRMTQEEERQLEAVLDLFLMKIVQEHFERQQASC
jgi:hypothetical protein